MKKTILVGVCGSVAAYKSIELVRALQKQGHDVEVLMSLGATKFIAPLQFESLLKKPVHIDVFGPNEGIQIAHIELAKKADCFVVVPASANTMAKLANGLCDDMLSTTFLAATCKKLICPAMNVAMYDNLATQRNIERLKSYGVCFVEPGEGLLACGDIGRGKLANIEDILDMIGYCLEPKPLARKRVLVSAGPTIEALDPVRFLTNHSSGKMGYALARKAMQLGATVTLVTGPTNLKIPYGVTCIQVTSASEMFDSITSLYQSMDYIIKAAAVGDYKASVIHPDKIKKSDQSLSIDLIKNKDILAYLGQHKQHQVLCGFAMETTNLVEFASKKCIQKNCDLLVANNLKEDGAGFKTDTNKVTFITPTAVEESELLLKDDLSKVILLKLKEIGEKRC